ncbi:hypothetical protein HSBAA_20030 [Vreelandella sulfidaeris]|uniref:Uncharacterized protein n=1 Tax=Vreelandella sulfidaeris TaxID=115553 RepID=A0A455U584_9GAMM|nr:hypothetical protein HSBAA_20030 [Halomonas sulfidaeris]
MVAEPNDEDTASFFTQCLVGTDENSDAGRHQPLGSFKAAIAHYYGRRRKAAYSDRRHSEHAPFFTPKVQQLERLL